MVTGSSHGSADRGRSWPCSPPGLRLALSAGSTPAFDFVAHLFYEIPCLARIRRPSQLLLVRGHLAVVVALAGVLGLALHPGWAGTAGPGLAIFWLGMRCGRSIWICGRQLAAGSGR